MQNGGTAELAHIKCLPECSREAGIEAQFCVGRVMSIHPSTFRKAKHCTQKVREEQGFEVLCELWVFLNEFINSRKMQLGHRC